MLNVFYLIQALEQSYKVGPGISSITLFIDKEMESQRLNNQPQSTHLEKSRGKIPTRV